MGSKKTKTTQTNRPIYSRQVEGAASGITSAYNAAQPAINQFSQNASDASSDLFARYREGDPTVDAANSYIQQTLSGDPAQNPYLDEMIAQSGDDVRNQMQAALGARGLTGGSDYAKLIAREMARNSLGLRYQDYGAERDRRAQAAGMAPGISAAQYLPLEAAMSSGQAGAMLPLQAAIAQGAGVGGLLGQYQDVRGTQRTSGGFFGDLLSSALGAAGAYFGGGGRI